MSDLKTCTPAPGTTDIGKYSSGPDLVQARYYENEQIAGIDMWIVYSDLGHEYTFVVVSDGEGSATLYPSTLAEHALYDAAVETGEVDEHLDLIAQIVIDIRCRRA